MDKSTLIFLVLNFLLIRLWSLLFILIDGFPCLLLVIEISLKLRISLKPVPSALENASLAANLLEKKAVLFFVFFDLLISSFVKIRNKNFSLVIDYLIQEFWTMSTPMPKVFIKT